MHEVVPSLLGTGIPFKRIVYRVCYHATMCIAVAAHQGPIYSLAFPTLRVLYTD